MKKQKMTNVPFDQDRLFSVEAVGVFMYELTSYRDQNDRVYLKSKFVSKTNPEDSFTKTAPVGTSEADSLIREYHEANSKSVLSSSQITQINGRLVSDAFKIPQKPVHRRFFKTNGKYYIAKDRHGKRLVEIGLGTVRLTIGPEGTGKTALEIFLVSLLDPSANQINLMSGSIDDIKSYANSNSLLGFDNASDLSAKMQDFLCVMSTGGSVTCRKFFTNDELSSIYLKKPSVITSISIPGIRPDLADRMVTIDMTEVTRDRLALSKLDEKIEALRGPFFSAIVHLFSEALAILPSIEIENISRMGDFEELGTAISQRLKLKKSFSDIYRKNLRNSAQEAVDNQPAVRLITQLITTKAPFEGTYGELLGEIRAINSSKEPLPRTEKALSVMLRRHEKALNKLGFTLVRPGRRGPGYLIQISYKRPTKLIKLSP